MDRIRIKLEDMIRQRGETLKSASEAIGRNHAYLQQFVKTGKPRVLPEQIRHKLAAFLHVNEAELRDHETISIGGAESFRFAPEVVPHTVGLIPLYGRAMMGSPDEFHFDAGNVYEKTPCPPYLSGVLNAFAIRAVGDSMEPRYYAGEVLYCNPNHPPRRSDFVVVEMQNGAGLVKQYLSATPDTITLRQLNPEMEIQLPRSAVKAIYRIEGSKHV